MFSPDGFVSLYDVAENYRRAGIGIDKFIAQCSQVQAVAVCTPSTQPVYVSTDLLHSVSKGGVDVFAFIDCNRWTVSLHLLREAAAGMSPELYVGSRLLLNTALDDKFAYPFPPEFAEGLEQFEGQQVVISDDDAEMMKAAIQSIARQPVKKYITAAELEQSFKTWILDNPHSTDVERNQWYTDHGIPRWRGRELWEKHKPADGSKAGPKPRNS